MKTFLIAIAIFSSGCGATISNHNHAPEIFLVDEGNGDLHLEWSQPLTSPQTVVIATTRFSYVQKHSLDLWVKHGMPIADAPEYLGREPQRSYRHFVFFEGAAASQPLSVLQHQLDAVIVEILTAEQAADILHELLRNIDFWRNQMFIPPPPTYALGTPHILATARRAQ